MATVFSTGASPSNRGSGSNAGLACPGGAGITGCDRIPGCAGAAGRMMGVPQLEQKAAPSATCFPQLLHSM